MTSEQAYVVAVILWIPASICVCCVIDLFRGER